MLKFCTNKPILASLLRQCFFWGERGRFAQKKGVMLLPPATDFREKKFSASSIIRIVSYCKYDMYFDKYDMYSIVGQNIHTLNILLHLHT